jgi:hypothetical protein
VNRAQAVLEKGKIIHFSFAITPKITVITLYKNMSSKSKENNSG